jgi:plasmid stabilization system protein ParE
MNFRVRFTEEALADLEQLYDFALRRDNGDWSAAESALDAIRNATVLLETSPFSCRKASLHDSFLRELIIGFGASGYVALFEIEDAKTVTVPAVRHQREDDYR